MIKFSIIAPDAASWTALVIAALVTLALLDMASSYSSKERFNIRLGGEGDRLRLRHSSFAMGF